MLVRIITPKGVQYSKELTSLTVMTGSGQITILNHHIPLISQLLPASAVARVGGDEEVFQLGSGALEVRRNNSVVILTDSYTPQYS